MTGRGSAGALPLRSGTVQAVVTSPPYWNLRAYQAGPQEMGQEPHPQQWVEALVAVGREVRRVLRDDGCWWLNCGDSFFGGRKSAGHGRNEGSYSSKQTSNRGANILPPDWKGAADGHWLQPKQKLMLPARLAIALQDDGWILRNEIVWYRRNAMPESVTDRLSSKHEMLYLLVKQPRYQFRLGRILQPLRQSTRARMAYEWHGDEERGYPHGSQNHLSRSKYFKGNGHARPQTNKDPGNAHDQTHPGGANPGDTWNIPTKPFRWPGHVQHFSTYPPELVRRCLLASTDPGDLVLDPFAGSGTTGMVAVQLGRRAVCLDLSWDYCRMAARRMTGHTRPLALDQEDACSNTII